MDKHTLESAMKLTADIEKLQKIKTALQGVRPESGNFNLALITRCLQELSTVTSVTPIIDHLKALVDATLDAQRDVLANL